ncbi:MAG: hypothetical protein M5U26_15445 [Planctomycetota bacterium]|nr:hypothetical protein [Planctomycetota bacterium]
MPRLAAQPPPILPQVIQIEKPADEPRRAAQESRAVETTDHLALTAQADQSLQPPAPSKASQRRAYRSHLQALGWWVLALAVVGLSWWIVSFLLSGSVDKLLK